MKERNAHMKNLQSPVKKPFEVKRQYTPSLVRSPFQFEETPRRVRGPHTLAKRTKPASKRKKTRRWLISASILVLLVIVIVFEQASGQGGAALADMLRATLGPTLTAQVESWYLGINDTFHQLQYHVSGQKTTAPWTIQSVRVTPTSTSTHPSTSSTAVTFAPMQLSPLQVLITPAIDGEGIWQPEVQSTATTNIPSLPIIARTFLRPDPVRPYAIVTMLRFDTRFMRLHMVAGTTEPGGPRGVTGSGIIPVADRQALLAAFNGGFKYADGQYGMMSNGVTYVPARPNTATIAVTKEGQIFIGAWGVDPRLTANNPDLVAWRQNAALLINHEVINPLTQDGAAWGGTVLNSTYTWRSGIGITADGSLVYAAGNSLSAQTLGVALHDAGAIMAMQTDINPYWVRAFLYSYQQQQLSITKLNPSMQGTGYEYLNGTGRDFFYLTYATPTLPARGAQREMTPQ